MRTQTNQKITTTQKVKSVISVKRLEGQSSVCAVTCVVYGTMSDAQTLPQMLTLKQLSGFVTAITNPCDFVNHIHS